MAKLAINGGDKCAADLNVPKWPRVPAGALERIELALNSGTWCRASSPESHVAQLEKAFREYHNANHAICVANGTVAIELALLACGVRPGDEVLVPALTFIASASAIVRAGAIPIFVDSDPRTLSISAESIEEAVTPQTRGVIAVHYGGYPINFDAVIPVCKKHGLFLIEDCAHAQGTEWRGRKVGAIGNMGTFSFQESKSFSLGEGGIVLTDDTALYEKAFLLHNIGRHLSVPGYDHLVNASNYRMAEILGALGMAQMDVFPAEVELRDRNGRYLAARLREIGGIEPLPEDERITKRGYYTFVMNYDADQFAGVHRDKFAEALSLEGVPCGLGYGVPLYRLKAFNASTICPQYPVGTLLPDYENLRLPVVEEFCAERQVVFSQTLLLGSIADMDLIVESVKKIKQHSSELS